MKKKKSSPINWKTVIAAILACGTGFGLYAKLAVTADTTENNKTEIKETKKDVEGLKELVMEQKIMNSSQYAINQSLVELLKKKNERI